MDAIEKLFAGFLNLPQLASRHGEDVDHLLNSTHGAMVLLFVGGVMNLAVIAALTVFVGFEKLGPFGVHTARASGALLIGAGVWMLLAPHV